MSDIQKEWYIGIDFGTSNTCIIAYEKNEHLLYSHSLADGMGDKMLLNIPSCISRDVNPANVQEPLYYVGTEASLHPVLRPYRGLKDAAREVTPNNGLFGRNSVQYPFEECGLDSNIEMGNDDLSLPVQVRELVLQFLRRVLHLKSSEGKIYEADEKKINKDTVKQIVIGQPVERTENSSLISYEDTLKGLLAECFTGKKEEANFIKKISVIPEPELAGITYLYSEEQRANKKVLVIDIGGGTTDFSVLEYKNGDVKAFNIGSCNVAGNAIDDLIFDILPDSIPHSKAKCRAWKESLFADKVSFGDNTTIMPKETDVLLSDNGYSDTEYKKGEKSFRLYYNSCNSYDYKIVIGEKIQGIYNEIGNALRNALDGKNRRNAIQIHGITTVFFCGGTSIITPLREHLVNIVMEKESKNGEPKYCVGCFDKKNDVVTMFSNDTGEGKTIKVSQELSIPITCYNAVAIGACIKAMGNKVHPRPAICFIQPDGIKIPFVASESNLLIKTEIGVPFARYIVDREFIDYWCNDPTSISSTIELNVTVEEEKSIDLILNKEDCISVGCLSIIAILKTSGIDFVAYASDDNYATSYATLMRNKSIPIMLKGDITHVGKH